MAKTDVLRRKTELIEMHIALFGVQDIRDYKSGGGWTIHILDSPRFESCLKCSRERALGWKPKVTFHGLVDMMVDADIALVGEELNGTAKRGRG